MDNAMALWALLFSSGDPLPDITLRHWLGLSQEALEDAAADLAARLQSTPFALRAVAEGWQLILTPSWSAWVSDRRGPRPDDSLSVAAWECLAVVAYRQPVTRLEVEQIRQVNSDRALDGLVSRGLIEEVGRKDTPGRPILYATTRKFLETFDLKDLSGLPPLMSSEDHLTP